MSKVNYLGVGVDIESIDRFKDLNKFDNSNLLTKIYTYSELEQCYGKSNPAQHLAKYFCGKEAVIKALSDIGHTGINCNNIEIKYTKPSISKVKLHKSIKNVVVHLCMSCFENKAVAFAIAVNQYRKI